MLCLVCSIFAGKCQGLFPPDDNGGRPQEIYEGRGDLPVQTTGGEYPPAVPMTFGHADESSSPPAAAYGLCEAAGFSCSHRCTIPRPTRYTSVGYVSCSGTSFLPRFRPPRQAALAGSLRGPMAERLAGVGSSGNSRTKRRALAARRGLLWEARSEAAALCPSPLPHPKSDVTIIPHYPSWRQRRIISGSGLSAAPREAAK